MNSTYSQAQEEESSAQSFSDTVSSGQSNGKSTPAECLNSDKRMDAWSHSLFSRWTSENLTDESLLNIQEWLTSLPAGSRVRTSLSPIRADVESMVIGLDCGRNSLIPFASYDRNSHSLKTAQTSLIEDLTESLQTLPRAGLMLGGNVYPLLSWERRIKEIESGLWPTPNAWDANRGPLGQTEIETGEHMTNLITAIYIKQGRGGQLNADWTEWLMGWPIGWTALKPLATAKFRSWLQQHGKYFQED